MKKEKIFQFLIGLNDEIYGPGSLTNHPKRTSIVKTGTGSNLQRRIAKKKKKNLSKAAAIKDRGCTEMVFATVKPPTTQTSRTTSTCSTMSAMRWKIVSNWLGIQIGGRRMNHRCHLVIVDATSQTAGAEVEDDSSMEEETEACHRFHSRLG